jgi:F-type H+-transporting ATPase subunit gamma
MPSVRQISRRIRSVQNTAKITKAMSMIAASKLRRSQDAATQGRAYADSMAAMVSNIIGQSQNDESTQLLMQEREIRNRGLVLITPDRGLTGGLNANLIRAASDFIDGEGSTVKVVAVGKKGLDFSRRNNLEVLGEITGLTDRPTPNDTRSVSNIMINSFDEGIVDSFHIVYAQFVNTTVQRAVTNQLVPVVVEEDSPGSSGTGYIYEPSADGVLSELLPRYVQTLVHHAVLEGNASEQSARMVAMNQATDNANAMVDDLTLLMNKIRQETITKELLDIVGGVAALEN